MTAEMHVRDLVEEAEAFLRGGDSWTASARARLAVLAARSMTSPSALELQQEVALASEGFEAAEEAARDVVTRRHALHVANERRAAGIIEGDAA